MDHIDIIMNRHDSINNELSCGEYGNVSIMGVGYQESMRKLETFMQEGCSKKCTLNLRLHFLGIALLSISKGIFCNIVGQVSVTFGT